jgi:hypothetical protein
MGRPLTFLAKVIILAAKYLYFAYVMYCNPLLPWRLLLLSNDCDDYVLLSTIASDPHQTSAVAINIWSLLNPLGHVRAWISFRMWATCNLYGAQIPISKASISDTCCTSLPITSTVATAPVKFQYPRLSSSVFELSLLLLPFTARRRSWINDDTRIALIGRTSSRTN